MGLRSVRSRKNGEDTHACSPPSAARRLPQLRVMGHEVAAHPGDLEASLPRRPREVLDGPGWHPSPLQQRMQQLPVAGEGGQVRVRLRGRGAQRLLRNQPAARAKQLRDPTERPHRVGLVHQEEPRIGQIERAAQRCWIQVVEVTRDHLDVAQPEGGRHRPRLLHRWRTEIDADDPAARPHQLRHDGEPTNRAAAAVDRMPPLLDADPAEGSVSHLRCRLRDAQQAPEVRIGAIEDVAPDPFGDRFRHAHPRTIRELRGFYPGERSARKALRSAQVAGALATSGRW
jgi:hypothetical protein